MARGDIDAGGGLLVPHGKGKLRRGARPLEEKRVTAEIRHDLGGEISELTGEKASIVADRYGWPTWLSFPHMPLAYIGGKTTGGTGDVVFVHRVGSDAGVFGSPVRSPQSCLRLRHHLADRLSPQSAGSECKGAEKAVVELVPTT